MKKILVICCLLVLIFTQNIFSQTLGELYTEHNAGFTVSMPTGWQVIDVGLKYLSILGPLDGGFTPNIGFNDEEFSGSISEYIDILMGVILLFSTEFRLLDRSSFRTDAGVIGECVTYLLTIGQIQVRQRVYVFPNRNRTAVMSITGTAPVIVGEKYDAIFDASVRTFNWTR
jgi:hypothetical protein